MSTDLSTGTDLLARYDTALMRTFGTPPRVLVRGDGCHVWDADGRRYLDLLGGLAVNALGHAHPKLIEAVTTQLGTLGHVSNLFTTPQQIGLAERLLTLLGSEGRVFLTNSGTEANEAALKATRRTGRTKIVSTVGAFHGRSMGALAITWNPAYREPFEPLPGDITFVDYGDADALAAAIDDDTAAFVVEPIQG
jgi:acetylornithine aminotransferase